MPPTGYLSTAGIEAALAHLESTYAFCQRLPLPETSREGRAISAIRIGAGNSTNGVLFIGGIHAREIVNPDLLVSFARALCDAYERRRPLKFGRRTYSPRRVRCVVEGVELFVLPLANPDGREHVFAANGDPMWRKNRSPNPGQPCKGVDLNRNCDFLWASGIGTSAAACSDVFKGSAAFSEPETRNVRHLLDAFPSLGYMLDVHSYSELVLYPWGDDTSQTTNPAMNFRNPAFDGVRGNPTDTAYQEYIAANDQNWLHSAGVSMRDAIAAVRGRAYTVKPSVLLYPTTGTTKDYAYSRHLVNATRRKVFAYTVETGTEFQPVYAEALNVIAEVSSGLMAFCERAISAGRAQITGVEKGRKRIHAIGGVDSCGRRWRLAEEDVIKAIRAEGREFYVERPSGDIVDVVVARRGRREYLKTTADGDEPNNLLELPPLRR